MKFYDESLSEFNANSEKDNRKKQDLDLGLEILEVDGSTVLEEMGASFGYNSCSSVAKIK